MQRLKPITLKSLRTSRALNMIEPLSWLTVIGLLLYLLILALQWWTKVNDDKQRKKDDENKTIDQAANADDLLRQFDKLRDS